MFYYHLIVVYMGTEQWIPTTCSLAQLWTMTKCWKVKRYTGHQAIKQFNSHEWALTSKFFLLNRPLSLATHPFILLLSQGTLVWNRGSPSDSATCQVIMFPDVFPSSSASMQFSVFLVFSSLWISFQDFSSDISPSSTQCVSYASKFSLIVPATVNWVSVQIII